MKRTVIVSGLAVVVALGLYTRTQATLVLNGSDSLPHNGYLMFEWPKTAIKGSYVAFDAPEEFGNIFDGTVFVKRVEGVAGDIITASDEAVCVGQTCRTLDQRLVQKGWKAISYGVVPDGKVVVFGDSDNSLDSRYAAVGVVDIKSEIRASGFPLPIPRWKTLVGWFK